MMHRYPALTLVTASTHTAITIDEAKDHLRVVQDSEDAQIGASIWAATKFAENYQNRSYLNQTWRLTMDDFPREQWMELPRAPLSSVTSVTYTKEDGSTSTLSSTAYIVDTDSEPGRVVLKRDEEWPTDVLERANAVKVTYVSGYGDTPNEIPETQRHLLKMLTAHWYEQREGVVTGTIVTQVPFTIQSLLDMDRVASVP